MHERQTRAALDQCIGELLGRLRLGRELSIDDAVAVCGWAFTRHELLAWERGERPLTVERLNTLALAYGVDTAWLLEEAIALTDAAEVQRHRANTCETMSEAPRSR